MAIDHYELAAVKVYSIRHSPSALAVTVATTGVAGVVERSVIVALTPSV